MEYGSQKAIGCLVALLAIPALGQELTYRVRREKMLRDDVGTLTFRAEGLVYQEVVRKEKKWAKPPKLMRGEWKYEDVQELKIEPAKVVVVLYADRPLWQLGVDREFEFDLLPGQEIGAAYSMLKDKLDRRLVAAVADADVKAEWLLPAKLLGTPVGSEGVLRVGSSRVVYETAKKGVSRTWRLEDIDNVASDDPYRLTVTTYERAQTGYGSRKDFRFQLKAPVDAAKLDALWRRLPRHAGLEVLGTFSSTGAAMGRR